MMAAAAALALLPAAAAAQSPHVQTSAEALAQDAAEYARAAGVSLEAAMQRLRAQQESVPFTDALRRTYGDRLAGISIEHQPQYRIVVLLTGTEPVPDQVIAAGGMQVPVVFLTGARATREQIIAAITRHGATIRSLYPGAAGMGADQRTGELVLLMKVAVADRHGVAEIEDRLAALTGVPVRVRLVDATDSDSSIGGGARVTGVDPASGRRYACTTGFVVTDGARTGIVTAAHCPDTITYLDAAGQSFELPMQGSWGARYQDVQLHITGAAAAPLFQPDGDRSRARIVTTWRNRESTRSGDVVCRRGQTSGYSCALVDLVDYAPPGELCGGPCDPTWVTLPGPSCKAGDSGGPIFSGSVAFGITKGGNYNPDGSCNFSFYMSTDYLPEGWSLMHAGAIRPNG